MLWGGGKIGEVVFKLGMVETKPWFARSSMFSVRKIMPVAKKRHEDKFPLPSSITDLKDLRIACIVDDFTALAYSPECKLVNLRTDDWQEKLDAQKPDMLFVESAWSGKDETWKWKVSIVSPELVQVVAYCKERGIPTVFWNKEDPKHYETFIRTAELFDFIFTTDIDLIPEYKRRLGTENVFLLSFAAQPRMHNPIETYDRKDAFCFAGSYYSQQLERNKTFSKFVGTISSLGDLEIFDRYLNTKDERLSFPQRYSRFIIGTLPPENIERAYKAYIYGVNMNTIRKSQSMFARRVFELLASNTVCVGNYSRGQHNLFGELTLSTDDIDYLKSTIKQLRSDPVLRDKFRLRGLREVMENHTYKHRLQYMTGKIFDKTLALGLPRATVIATPDNLEEMDRVLSDYRRQTYEKKELVLFWDGGDIQDAVVYPRSIINDIDVSDVATDLVFLFNPCDYHGENYLKDLALGVWWSKCNVVGKATFYDGEGSIHSPGNEYHFVDSLPLRSSAIGVIRLAGIGVGSLLSELDEGMIGEGPCLSLDRFNYCLNSSFEENELTRDLETTEKGLSWNEIRELSENIPPKGVLISPARTMLLFGNYPSPRRKGGFNYLQVRPWYYQDCGVPIDVYRFNRSGDDEYYDIQGIQVNHVSNARMKHVLNLDWYKRIDVHMLYPEMWDCLREHVKDSTITIYVYGPGVPIPEMVDCLSRNTLNEKGLKKEMKVSMAMWKEVVSCKDIQIVFASKFLADCLLTLTRNEFDPKRFRIVGPPVDETCYCPDFSERRDGSIIVMRPYYGACLDEKLIRDIILGMSKYEGFEDLSFTLLGDWTHDIGFMEPLKSLHNVKLVSDRIDQYERGDILSSNTILLSPMMIDPNCVSISEAMACGTVPVVSDVGAVKELVDETCGFIVDRDAVSIADAMMKLISDGTRLRRMSEAGKERIKKHRGEMVLESEVAELLSEKGE
jgi:spore maturation protein CgeB